MHRTPKWSMNCESFAYFGETKTQMERVNSRTWSFAWSFSRGRRLEDSRSSLSLCSEVFWDGGWAYPLCGWRDLVQALWGLGEPLRFTVTSLLCSCHSETLLDRLVTWQTFRGRSQKYNFAHTKKYMEKIKGAGSVPQLLGSEDCQRPHTHIRNVVGNRSLLFCIKW